jgi:hypothetical protein
MNENDKYICEQLLGSAGVRHAPLAMLLSFDESTTWTYVPAASGKGGEWNLVNTRSLSAGYDGLPLIFPEINRCGGCDDEMLLNVGKFPQDVDSKGRLVPLRKYGPLSGSDNRQRTKNLSHSAQTADRELQIMKAVEEKQNALNDVHAKVARALLTCMCACMRAG